MALFGIPVASGIFLGSGSRSYIIMGVTFGALLVFSGIFYLFYRLWKRRKGNTLSKMLRKNSGAHNIEGLESLRANFEDGVDKLRRAGKNVYELPWFLLAGQAGAGKTEAIRRSHAKEDFPPGLNDLMQGVGGTLNMNWWFANKAIVLDTAGRIFEEKLKAGQSNEWLEFLKMLKKARKHMPINGFVLAIPADSLIRDSIHEIEKKASHIAEQLSVVQNTLGVRFPVFVLITKTDFVPGFREFVENVREPRLQQQILGWSNPNNLDEPFAPEQVDEYLSGVIEKLKKRRLTYMLDPQPTNGGKRLDELDALFTFPHHLREVFPNLRRYLEIVFAVNPWADRPLFIRGIYFTSSLQEGEALDAAIASVMGKDLSEMALSSFKKENALFLRDMFFDKIYREYGLVTSAKRVSASMRRRAILFGMLSLLAVFAILGAAWFGGRSFQEQVGQESLYWQLAAEQLEDADNRTDGLKWKQPILYAHMGGDQFAVKSNQDHKFKLDSGSVKLAEYLSNLGAYAQKQLEVPAVFRPLRFFDRVFAGDRFDRREAFRRVFETSVVYPILENAGEKLRDGAVIDDKELKGLRAMIRIQALLNRDSDQRGEGFATSFFNELEALHIYLVDEPIDESIGQVYRDFYGDPYIAESGWPSERHSTLYGPADTLEDERLAGVKVGMENWRASVEGLGQTFRSEVNELEKHLGSFEELEVNDAEFLTDVKSTGVVVPEAIDLLEREYSSRVQSIIEEFGGKEGEFKFSEALDQESKAMDAAVRMRVTEFTRDFENTGTDPLIIALADEVAEAESVIQNIRRSTLTDSLNKRAAMVDSRFLSESGGLRARVEAYRTFSEKVKALQAVQLARYQDAEDSISQAVHFYEQAIAAVSEYGGYRSENIQEILQEVAGKVYSEKRAFFAGAYYVSASDVVRDRVGFPLLRDSNKMMTKEEISDLRIFVTDLKDEMGAFLEKIEHSGDKRYDDFSTDLQKLERFIGNHFVPEVMESDVALSIPPVSRLSKANGSRSILWNARLVQGSQGVPKRFGHQPVSLGSLKLDASIIELRFQSTLGGSPGDVGNIVERGEWMPLQIMLSGSQVRRDEASGRSGKRYLVSRTVPLVGGGSSRGVVFALTLPLELPAPEGWLTSEDLSILRR